MKITAVGTCLAIALSAFGQNVVAADTDIALGKPVTALSGFGFSALNGSPLATLTDGLVLPEGTYWQAGTVWWNGLGGFMVDLGQDYVISSITVQHDNNDIYMMTSTSSHGGLNYSMFGPHYNYSGGMSTSSVTFASPLVANQLSFISVGGDGMYSMSEINVLGHVVAVPEPETYALMLAGLGLLGLAARRKKLV